MALDPFPTLLQLRILARTGLGTGNRETDAEQERKNTSHYRYVSVS